MGGKVTKDMAAEMFCMRSEGYSISQIGERFGVSGQTVWEITGKSKHFKRGNKCLERVVYPGLARWMRINGVSMRGLSQKCGMGNNDTISRTLRGKTVPTMNTIGKILKATGLTYEEAFGQEENSGTG